MSTPDPVRSCITKKRYGSEDLAERVAAARFRAVGIRLRVYSCGECAGFHLTKINVQHVESKPGWRPAKVSQRDIAAERERGHARRRHGRRDR